MPRSSRAYSGWRQPSGPWLWRNPTPITRPLAYKVGVGALDKILSSRRAGRGLLQRM